MIQGVTAWIYMKARLTVKGNIYALFKEIFSFANTNVGTILIGVQDNGNIIGMDNADFEIQQIADSIRDSIRPDITIFTNMGLIV